MGGGISKPKGREYSIKFDVLPSSNEATPREPATTLEQVKKPLLKKNNSDPKLITSTTVFCPYVDLQFGRKGSNKVVQRAVSRSKSTLVGEGKLDYKKSDYYELSGKFPWLIKNAHFVRPALKEFIIGRVIGAGRFAKVHLVRTSRNKYFCLKVLRKDKELFKNNEVRHVLNERNCLYELHSPFTMKLFAEFEDQDFAYLALEYAVGGELRALLLRHKENKLSLEEARFYLIEVFAALEHMHGVGYVHRDIRPENICVDEEGHVKLIDFGYTAHISTNVNGKLYTICCSPSYLSPELLNSKYQGGYGMEVDWWAYGVLAYELFFGSLPFGDSNDISTPEILLNILKHKLHLPFSFDAKAKEFLSKLFDPDLTKRLSEASAVKRHTFFIDVTDWSLVEQRRLPPPHVPEVKGEGDSSHFPMHVQSAKHWTFMNSLENKIQII